MNVCIVGAGFFGLHLAYEFQKSNKDLSIDIYEAYHKPFLSASSNNQCRLHQGFHYPRSGFTIYQSIISYDRFLEQYGGACSKIDNNYYAIAKNGLVSAEQYFSVMDSFHLEYEHTQPPNFLKQPKNIEAIIKVPEQRIDLGILEEILLKRLDCNFFFNSQVTNINPGTGDICVNHETIKNYDLIINASYTNPNLGATSNFFKIKLELAAMVNCKTNFNYDTAITIMDGPFVSVYPSSKSHHTLSSVIETPFKKNCSVDEIINLKQNIKSIAERENVSKLIKDHVKSFIDIDILDSEIWAAPKVKLASDFGDSRVTKVACEKKLISVLCGKLDAVFEASDKILSLI